jgi:hypothetical protein
MRKLILILSLFLVAITLQAQIYVLVDPLTYRAGLIYNQRFNGNLIGTYLKLQYGIIDKIDFYTHTYKAGLGISYGLKSDGSCVYLGLNYNYFFKTVNNTTYINLSRISKVSFDIGVSSGKQSKFKMMIITDPINWESSVGFSYKFD